MLWIASRGYILLVKVRSWTISRGYILLVKTRSWTVSGGYNELVKTRSFSFLICQANVLVSSLCLDDFGVDLLVTSNSTPRTTRPELSVRHLPSSVEARTASN
ncbi:hypothetical protein ElyMa_005616700 [Elysia marginata]|uniref:Uncharacterized protein n=1 Tax=Elysia marginata TaxID=1093978 RepID=A0AAV4F6C4_9GAST|nr:hypothetical protein ElyMa_005616700 [Elysia marginata]